METIERFLERLKEFMAWTALLVLWFTPGLVLGFFWFYTPSRPELMPYMTSCGLPVVVSDREGGESWGAWGNLKKGKMTLFVARALFENRPNTTRFLMEHECGHVKEGDIHRTDVDAEMAKTLGGTTFIRLPFDWVEYQKYRRGTERKADCYAARQIVARGDFEALTAVIEWFDTMPAGGYLLHPEPKERVKHIRSCSGPR